MALAKKCDRCGNLYEHYPKSKLAPNNAIRRVYKNEYGNISSQDDTMERLLDIRYEKLKKENNHD